MRSSSDARATGSNSSTCGGAVGAPMTDGDERAFNSNWNRACRYLAKRCAMLMGVRVGV